MSPRQTKLALIGQLASEHERTFTAQRLARLYKADSLIFFHKDKEIGAFLPAPGFLQTLRKGRRWRDFLKECEDRKEVEAMLPWGDLQVDVPVIGRCRNDLILALIGGEPAIADDDDLLVLAPLVAKAFNGELEMISARASVALDRNKAESAAVLADSLERARSDLADALAEARSAHNALRIGDRRKDEFLAVLAHELRNPLAPIGNGLDILRHGNLSADALENVRTMMEKQLRHMVRLIEDLMDVSRITQGKITLRQEKVSLSSVVDMAVDATRDVINRHHHELQIHLPEQPVVLSGDPARFTQIFSNLLNNAAKFTRPHGQITLSAQVQRETVEVSVTDTGIGMTGGQLESIFDMFSQVDANDHHLKAGLGVGLSLVKSLVELHGGTISAASEGLNSGSAFKVCLPCQPDRPLAPVASNPVRHSDSSDGSYRILIVDDNVDSAESMAMAMEMLGHSTRCAYDGQSAIRVAHGYRPDILLLDIGLPDIDGYEVCRRLRLCLSAKSVFIAQTGWGQETDRDKARAAGFDHHLTKPIELSQLRQILKEV